MEIYSRFQALPPQEVALSSLRLPETENTYNTIRRTYSTQITPSTHNISWSKMFPTELIGSNGFLEFSDEKMDQKYEVGIRTNGTTLVMNSSVNDSEATFVSELFYRHSAAMTVVYCVAYILVFAVGLVGNCFVIAVVFRSPRMRTVTNFFIVNLAIADILVIVFCLPATLTSNIFVRKYNFKYFINLMFFI